MTQPGQSRNASPAQRVSSGQSDKLIEWAVSSAERPVAYLDAVAAMERRIAEVRAGAAAECVWLLEHSPLYTAGTSARETDLLMPERFPVFQTGRGGQYTYHGPGQQIAYVMLDVRARFGDVRRFVSALEGWIVDTLGAYGLAAVTRPERVGIWVPIDKDGRPVAEGPDAVSEAKIAALGIRLRKWVSMHGVAINIAPDLSHFEGIVPCGISQFPTTSLAALGCSTDRQAFEVALRNAFHQRFGATVDAPVPLDSGMQLAGDAGGRRS